MSLVENERTKLLAGALDRMSTACVTVGIVAPGASLVYGFGGRLDAPAWFLLVAFVAWSLGALILHLVARWVLGGIKQ